MVNPRTTAPAPALVPARRRYLILIIDGRPSVRGPFVSDETRRKDAQRYPEAQLFDLNVIEPKGARPQVFEHMWENPTHDTE